MFAIFAVLSTNLFNGTSNFCSIETQLNVSYLIDSVDNDIVLWFKKFNCLFLRLLLFLLFANIVVKMAGPTKFLSNHIWTYSGYQVDDL